MEHLQFIINSKVSTRTRAHRQIHMDLDRDRPGSGGKPSPEARDACSRVRASLPKNYDALFSRPCFSSAPGAIFFFSAFFFIQYNASVPFLSYCIIPPCFFPRARGASPKKEAHRGCSLFAHSKIQRNWVSQEISFREILWNFLIAWRG